MQIEPVRSLGLTFLSAHSGPGRKLVTLTEVSALLQVRDGKTNARARECPTIAAELAGKMILEPAKGLEPPTY